MCCQVDFAGCAALLLPCLSCRRLACHVDCGFLYNDHLRILGLIAIEQPIKTWAMPR